MAKTPFDETAAAAEGFPTFLLKTFENTDPEYSNENDGPAQLASALPS
jgi:hypothetical protein